MATTFPRVQPSEPFRWKLFLFIVLIMGSITAGAIILTLMAMPSHEGVHAPPPQPVSQVDYPLTNVSG